MQGLEKLLSCKSHSTQCGWPAHTYVHIPLSVTTAVILCFLCYHQSRCSRSISLARVSGHMVLTHRLQLMPIVFDMLWLLYSRCGRRTCPKHLSGLFCTFWFSYFPLCDCCTSPRQTSRWVRVTKSICVMNLWQTVWFTCCSAVKNLALTKWTPYIYVSVSFSLCSCLKNCAAGSISPCLDTCRGSGLDKQGCQRGALVNREIIQTVGH